jgi:hypothetical protein
MESRTCDNGYDMHSLDEDKSDQTTKESFCLAMSWTSFQIN